jgi:hypothetical protein
VKTADDGDEEYDDRAHDDQDDSDWEPSSEPAPKRLAPSTSSNVSSTTDAPITTTTMPSAPPNAPVLFTLGHSTRTQEQLEALLRGHGVQILADIRRWPGSRKYPHFNQKPFRKALESASIRYVWLGNELGGRRRAPAAAVRASAWRNPGFAGYAEHMRSEDFVRGVAALESLAGEAPTAMMCAEGSPFSCHRRMLSDVLLARGRVRVMHISSARSARPHQLTDFARIETPADASAPPAVVYVRTATTAETAPPAADLQIKSRRSRRAEGASG